MVHTCTNACKRTLQAVSRMLHLQTSCIGPVPSQMRCISWLRTNGVNTNGVAAKVINFDRLGKKLRPGTFGKIKVG